MQPITLQKSWEDNYSIDIDMPIQSLEGEYQHTFNKTNASYSSAQSEQQLKHSHSEHGGGDRYVAKVYTG
jgi:hypothetical protein